MYIVCFLTACVVCPRRDKRFGWRVLSCQSQGPLQQSSWQWWVSLSLSLAHSLLSLTLCVCVCVCVCLGACWHSDRLLRYGLKLPYIHTHTHTHTHTYAHIHTHTHTHTHTQRHASPLVNADLLQGEIQSNPTPAACSRPIWMGLLTLID